MGTSIDRIKALREELKGFIDVERSIRQRERACEEAMAKAETELNDVRKIRVGVRAIIDLLRQQIAKLEQEH